MSKGTKVTLGIFFRLLPLPLIFYSSIYLAPFFTDFVKANYQEPFGIGFLYGIDTSFISMTLPIILLSGIIYGAFGKKIDYIIFGLLFIGAMYFYSIESNVALALYLGLIGVAVVGNLIGYALKLARLRWTPRGRTSGAS